MVDSFHLIVSKCDYSRTQENDNAKEAWDGNYEFLRNLMSLSEVQRKEVTHEKDEERINEDP